jgi:arylsulfatase A-like enzyme
MNNQSLPDIKPDTPTVATYLNAAGYLTGFVGKAHLGGDPRRWAFKECPVFFSGGTSPHEDPVLTVNGEMKTVPGQITELFADGAIQFLEKHKQDRWFLWFATTAPHTPYIMERHYRARDIDPPPGWPANEPLDRPGRLAGFYVTVEMLDEQVGRVLQKLDELGLAKNTLVFMTSDNGIMFGSHGTRAKGTWFEGASRVPALARWPGKIRPGTKTAAPMDSVDFLSTVLDAAGVRTPLPKMYQSKSMLPALTGGKALRKVAYSELEIIPMFGGGYWEMARDQRWKYVISKTGEEHLYDLKNDPSENQDLANPEHADVVREMREKLTAWEKATPRQTEAKSSEARPITRSAAGICSSP